MIIQKNFLNISLLEKFKELINIGMGSVFFSQLIEMARCQDMTLKIWITTTVNLIIQ